MDFLECDVHLTKDGVVIVAHDGDLARLCGVHHKIEDLNYDEIPPFMDKFYAGMPFKEYFC